METSYWKLLHSFLSLFLFAACVGSMLLSDVAAQPAKARYRHLSIEKDPAQGRAGKKRRGEMVCQLHRHNKRQRRD